MLTENDWEQISEFTHKVAADEIAAAEVRKRRSLEDSFKLHCSQGQAVAGPEPTELRAAPSLAEQLGQLLMVLPSGMKITIEQGE